MKHRLILFIILITSILTATAEVSSPISYFIKAQGENYISQSNVKAILQDSYNFMWFGTRNGLNRYDGHSFREFAVDDKELQCGNHNISALYEDNNKQLWVGTDKGIYLYDPTHESFRHFTLPSNNGTVINDWVSAIEGDKNGNIWIIIPNQGAFRYSESNGTMDSYHFSEKITGNSGTPQSICIRENGEVWIGTDGVGLFCYNKELNIFEQLIVDAAGKSLYGENVYTFCEYNNGFAIGIHEGKLMRYDFNTNLFSEFDTPQIHYKIIRAVKCFGGTLYVGTQNGLYIINKHNKDVWHVEEDTMNPYGLSDNNVFSLYQDRQGGVWIGTMFGGVDYLPARGYNFRKYFPTNQPNSLKSRRIHEMCEDRYGRIWIGSDDNGVHVYDPKTNQFISKRGVVSTTHSTLAMYAEDDAVYCGIFKQGMEIFNIDNNSVKFISGHALNLHDEQSVCAIFKDSQGGYWLGNSWGIYYAPDDNRQFKRMSEFGYGYIYDIAEDNHKQIWIATMGSGVWCYDLKDKKLRKFTSHTNDSTTLSSNSVSSITVDSRGDIWFATDRGGVCRYNSQKGNFTTFTEKDGLPDNVSYKILEDSLHNLWFGTNKGLVCFNPTTKDIQVYTKDDGLLSNQFNYKSALKAQDGTFYFGSIDGLLVFDPYNIDLGDSKSNVYITGLQIHNKSIAVGDADSILKTSIHTTDKIELNYKQNNLVLEYVALDYVSPANNQYRYRMQGIDKEWVITNATKATYSQLPPGQYTFEVQCANNKGQWTEDGASVSVVITPPWWKTVYAYTVYLLLLIVVTYSFINRLQERNRQKAQREYNLLEIRKEKELYSSKVAFFTSIAHEIKTPLSLIKAPLESLLNMNIEDMSATKLLQVMEMNTNRLLTLINQLLDFRKIEGNRLSLNYTMQDIKKLLDETVTRFEPSINQAGKSIVVESDIKEFIIPIDREEVTKVLSNLLNNGLKYAAQTIKVTLTHEEEMINISVYTDGEIIQPDKRSRIFEPFYQLDEESSGVGLGLSLARSIVELHKGYLSLDVSPDGKYNIFTCALPCSQSDVIIWNTADNEAPITHYDALKEESGLFDMSGCSVLVVDDNPELLSFLVDRLSDKFIVHQAHDGEEALGVLSREVIHIVVSDVMMPRMDGFELCRRIKSMPEYNHIPVILLSAQNDIKSKLFGIEQGADAYMEKPFSFAYLVARVNNLLANRQIERESLIRRPISGKMNTQHTKADEELMQRIAEEVQKNMHNEDFNVEKLAANLNMSRTVLHRKMKVLFNLPPVEYIRVARLQRAAQLLSEGKTSIAEAGAMVGINTPSYFSRLFQKQFGVMPKVFVNQQRERQK